MTAYPSVKLVDAALQIRRGISPRYAEVGVLVINQRCIRDGRVTLEAARYHDMSRRVAEDRYLVPFDVLVNSTGVGTLGRVAQWGDSMGIRATVDSHVTIVRPDPEVVDGRYFGYAMLACQTMIESMGEGATGQTELSRSRLGEEVSVPVPPPAVQRKIGAVLAAYDELIENNLRRIEILEEMAQAVYREWFVNFRYPGHEGVEMVDSPTGELPQGWLAAEFGDIADEWKDGVVPGSLDPDTPYVGLEHIPRESFTMKEWGRVAEVSSRKWRFGEGDILFGRLRPYFHKVAVAARGGVASTDAIVIRPRPGFSDLALQVAFSQEFVAHAVAASGGTDRPRAKWDDLAQFPVPIPTEGVLGRFSRDVSPVVTLATRLAAQNTNLRATRDLLLPRLVSGELDVSELDIDTDWLVA